MINHRTLTVWGAMAVVASLVGAVTGAPFFSLFAGAGALGLVLVGTDAWRRANAAEVDNLVLRAQLEGLQLAVAHQGAARLMAERQLEEIEVVLSDRSTV